MMSLTSDCAVLRPSLDIFREALASYCTRTSSVTLCCIRSVKEVISATQVKKAEEKIAILKHVFAHPLTELFPDGRM